MTYIFPGKASGWSYHIYTGECVLKEFEIGGSEKWIELIVHLPIIFKLWGDKMESDLDELKKQAVVDNSELEEIMKKDITPESQREFFEIFKESQLFMPVILSSNMFEGIEDAKEGDIFEPNGQAGFDINYLNGSDGTKAIPLFTSSQIMESTGLKSSAIAIFMSDLAEMLKQTDKYSIIAVNPFTEYDINMPVDAFLGLFEEKDEMFETLNGILKILKEKSVELEEDHVFFVRDDENFMKDNSVNGVFIPGIPFNASIREDFKKDCRYLNILLMPKTKKIVYIGNVVDEDHYDTIIAPGSEFHMVEEIDEFTTVWKCGNQPFYEE